jgi:hypothetical protein
MRDDGTPADAARRRVVLGSGSAVVAAFGGPVAALALRQAQAASAAGGCRAGSASSNAPSPYGPVAPVADATTGLTLLELPAGFSYASFGWRGDRMGDGLATPRAHDGMGIVRVRGGGRSDRDQEIWLVRNHEISPQTSSMAVLGTALAPEAARKLPSWDRGDTAGRWSGGGTSTVVWRDGRWAEAWMSLAGLDRPCAGGASAWGSWLANEEVLSDAVSSAGRRHGYVFEVAADSQAQGPEAQPIVGMGRMSHEACALDTATGDWYLTEDQWNANTLYRFRPKNAGGGLGSLLAGGRLQALAVRGRPNADLRDPTLCQRFDCEWVEVAEPDADGARLAIPGIGEVPASGPYRQAFARGAAVFGATEGCWVARGQVWFTDKQVTAAPAPDRAGRIWRLDLASMTLEAVFVSASIHVGNSPDNLCLSPRGGVLFCEDGGPTGPGAEPPATAQHLRLLHPDGASSVFARHAYQLTAAQLEAAGKPAALAGDRRNTEFAGCTFAPDGRVLFVNLYDPGITLAIRGPFERGLL